MYLVSYVMLSLVQIAVPLTVYTYLLNAVVDVVIMIYNLMEHLY